MPHLSAKACAILLLAAVITVAAFAQKPDEHGKREERRPVNLQVLPKGISHDSLSTLMRQYSVSLGVRCGFCHAPSATEKDRLNFASDDNKRKAIARDMMRMTAGINSQYFAAEIGDGPHKLLAVSCYTCHHGHEDPELMTMPKEEEKH